MMAAAMILRFLCARHGPRSANCAHRWTRGVLVLFASLAVSAAVAQTPSPAVTPPAATTPATAESLQALTGLVNTIVRENLPADFESRDNWGHTTDVWAGVDIRREGLQIKTKRRKKQVNDGTWKLVRVRFIEPETNLHLEVLDVRPLPAGRVEVDLAVDAKLAVFARLSQWELGVQLISLSANAQAQTQFRVRCDLGLKLDPTKLPPDVILDPVVREAELRLVDFRLDRVSQVGGSLAHELGATGPRPAGPGSGQTERQAAGQDQPPNRQEPGTAAAVRPGPAHLAVGAVGRQATGAERSDKLQRNIAVA